MKWRRIVVIVLVAICLSLFIVPTFAQLLFGGWHFSAKTENIIHVETADETWMRTTENTVNFSLAAIPLIGSFKIKIRYNWNISEAGPYRTTVIIYKIYSNDVYVGQIYHDLVGIDSGYSGGDYDPIVIPSETLRVGENTIKVLMTFNSSTSEKPTEPGMFHFVVKDIQVYETL